jgi:hypothetical protein
LSGVSGPHFIVDAPVRGCTPESQFRRFRLIQESWRDLTSALPLGASLGARLTTQLRKENKLVKRIPVSELRLGMYIHKLAGSWFRHPFWRGSFLLTEPQDLSAIRECGVGEVWVDLAKSQVDPESPESPESPEPRAQSPEPRAQSPENCRRSNLCRLVH